MIGLRALALACLIALPAWPDGCAPVQQDQIVAADLAAVVPVFGKLSPDIPIAPAPIPGARRVLRASELLSLAKRYSLDLEDAMDICFEWPMRPLEREQVLAAMKAALPFPDIHIELLEGSSNRVPSGRLEFRRENLGHPGLSGSRTPVSWRGSVVYGKDHRFSFWARVIVSATLQRVIAAEPIRRGEPITAGQVRTETVESFPGAGDVARTAGEVVGKIAARNIDAGAEIHLNQIARSADVHRGDPVEVEVTSGKTHLSFTGKSESEGRTGDLIRVRNTRSNKIFQARVNGKGKAFIDTGAVREN
jgi:flagella basal body P-ring formation protein FlgA